MGVLIGIKLGADEELFAWNSRAADSLADFLFVAIESCRIELAIAAKGNYGGFPFSPFVRSNSPMVSFPPPSAFAERNGQDNMVNNNSFLLIYLSFNGVSDYSTKISRNLLHSIVVRLKNYCWKVHCFMWKSLFPYGLLTYGSYGCGKATCYHRISYLSYYGDCNMYLSTYLHCLQTDLCLLQTVLQVINWRLPKCSTDG